MAWISLLVAGIFEVAWAYYLKASQGLSLLVPSLLFLLTLTVSMGLLGFSVRSIPLGVAYPIWTGVGAVGSVVVGALFFHEPLGALKVLFLVLIVSGIVGLKAIN